MSEELKPAVLENRPLLKKALEVILTVALAYLGARFGIPINEAQGAEPPPPATATANEVELKEFTAGPIGTWSAEVAPTIAGKTEYPAHALVRLRAEHVPSGAAVLWRVSPRAGVDRATTKPDVLEFAGPPGSYDVELLTIAQKDGVLSVSESMTRVTIGVPKKDAPPASGKLDPVGALGRIQFGSAGCTATVIGPRRADGRWDVLTAAHCLGGVGAKGTLSTKDGKKLAVRCVVHQKGPDLAWLVTEAADLDDLAFANLSASNPAVGVKVWHMGYGVDRPGNREDGSVAGDPNGDNQLRFVLSVSSGDSGGGILRADTNEVVSTVCCTAGLSRVTNMWGASTSAIRAARPGTVSLDQLPEPQSEDVQPHTGCALWALAF